MNDVTEILSAIDSGDMASADRLLPLVYEELRKLAKGRLSKEKTAQTLQPTALVHEAYLRLVDSEQSQHFNSRGHFFAAAAEAMRRILVDRARQKARPKHGGDLQRVELEPNDAHYETPSDELLAINEVLVRFEEEHPEKAELVKMRYFVGMTLVEAAEAKVYHVLPLQGTGHLRKPGCQTSFAKPEFLSPPIPRGSFQPQVFKPTSQLALEWDTCWSQRRFDLAKTCLLSFLMAAGVARLSESRLEKSTPLMSWEKLASKSSNMLPRVAIRGCIPAEFVHAESHS